ncbi:MAG: SusC/RagA family TonB-linked outer membrane protein [Bacteroidetes bacterium]|nr:SusC/RagA family TonB-linked outer membrane protein [Bacteroidota bacterium]
MQKNLLKHLIACLILLGVSITLSSAQNVTLTGTIYDSNRQPLPGVSVVIEGTTKGTASDMNGGYAIKDVAPGTYTLVASFIGYNTQKLTVKAGGTSNPIANIVLTENTVMLNTAVAIGYGKTAKKDLTGSVTAITNKDFNKGNVVSPAQLIAGKIAGVNVTQGTGAPGSSARIRIRGGSSLNASNDPLIVIDGVPVDNNTLSGSADPLSMINSADIESMTVLKDASAAAIYGSRAANGVIIITTKRGSGNRLSVEFNSTNSIGRINKTIDVLTGDEYRAMLDTLGASSNDTLGNFKRRLLAGTANTDWQDEVYRQAFSSENNLSIAGGIKQLPYRINIGFLKQEGVLDRSLMDRFSGGINLSPTFFKDHLKVDVNAKYTVAEFFFANQGAIGSAVTFDPTQPVLADSTSELYNGYFEWLDNKKKPNVLAPRNPVGLINQREDNSSTNRLLGNVQLDYKMHFLPELRTNLNLGMDKSHGQGNVMVPATAASDFFSKGTSSEYVEDKSNQLLEFYFNYLKQIKAHKIDVTAGYSYQDWIRERPAFPRFTAAGDSVLAPAGIPFKTQNTLVSFYGRINYSLLQKYLVTVTVREDGSSRFSPENRWGTFPSVAFAWRAIDEFRPNNWLSDLKVRLGWGITGQQDILSDYPYIPNYSQGDSSSMYQFGNTYYNVLRPDGYDANIKWEQTETQNIGIDFGFIKNRIAISLDLYKKSTDDLLNTVPVPAGTNFTNNVLTNVGAIENKGIEVSINTIPITGKNIEWELNVNGTYNKNMITKLTTIDKDNDVGVLTGGIGGGTGNTIQVHTVGYSTNTFYVYKHKLDANGNPIQPLAVSGAKQDTVQFEDLNGDGQITSDDRYRYKNPEAPFFAGLTTRFTYKRISFAMGVRGAFGLYIYDNVNSQLGNKINLDASKNYINNVTSDYLTTNFKRPLYFSDYYIKNASYVRIDNISLSYDFSQLTKKFGLRAGVFVQNAAVFTKYKGLDPEVAGGIDNNVYPRPRIMGLNISLSL